MTQNIVNWGLAKSSWFKITKDASGNDLYGAPTLFAGNRQINFTPVGDLVNVYADGTVVFVGKQNSGYTGTIESTFLDDDFVKWVLSEEVDSNNVQYEIQEPVVNRFGILWEWVGDQKKTRHVMYNITASRPDVSATTAGDGGTKSAQYRTLNLTAIPRADGIVKATTRGDISSTVYNGWFDSVYNPTGTSEYPITFTVVTDDVPAAPVAGALVVLGDGSQAWTNALGLAVIYKPTGTYDVIVSKSGFTVDVDTVTVATAAVSKTIEMTESQ